MKYQIGDHVKYDSCDWLFFGTITAVIDNSINPCYRLIVNRMKKKNCRFSLTQFEFELLPDEKFSTDKDSNKWEKTETEYLKKNVILQPEETSPLLTPEPATLPIHSPIQSPETKPVIKRTPKPKLKPKPITSPKPITKTTQKSQLEEQRLEEQRLEEQRLEEQQPEEQRHEEQQPEEQQPEELVLEEPKTVMVEVPQESPTPMKFKKRESWDRNLDLYMNGVRNNVVHKWISQNRKKFNDNSLSEEKRNKLIEINFSFEPTQRTIRPKEFKNQNKSYQRNSWWDYKIKQWKAGKYEALKSWRQKCVKLYVTRKLPQERIDQLKEIGILH